MKMSTLVPNTEAAVARRCSVKKKVFKIWYNPPKNIAKHIGVSFYFQLYLKLLRHRCFPVNLAKFLRTLFYRTTPVAASVRIFEMKIFLSPSCPDSYEVFLLVENLGPVLCHFLIHYFISCHGSLFIPPENIRNPFYTFSFSGGIERGQWHEIGY